MGGGGGGARCRAKESLSVREGEGEGVRDKELELKNPLSLETSRQKVESGRKEKRRKGSLGNWVYPLPSPSQLVEPAPCYFKGIL